ncbi:hypothetical protein ACFSSC_05440 [Corynebacterium mendelii]|uniref:YbjN domain-containing protein n=1 Tax=Corynebacterium mendelii TaxID=2765362 RepID=A0A939DZV1_9CORY|nr:hypothetical protein [Corynebacterium mendelii]MBN9643156.1 hypothetical protein [Corynebacterium mendelii]
MDEQPPIPEGFDPERVFSAIKQEARALSPAADVSINHDATEAVVFAAGHRMQFFFQSQTLLCVGMVPSTNPENIVDQGLGLEFSRSLNLPYNGSLTAQNVFQLPDGSLAADLDGIAVEDIQATRCFCLRALPLTVPVTDAHLRAVVNRFFVDVADAIKLSVQQTGWACDEFTPLAGEQFAGDLLDTDVIMGIATKLGLSCHLDEQWGRYEIGGDDTVSVTIDEDPSGQLRIWCEMTTESPQHFHDEDYYFSVLLALNGLQGHYPALRMSLTEAVDYTATFHIESVVDIPAGEANTDFLSAAITDVVKAAEQCDSGLGAMILRAGVEDD